MFFSYFSFFNEYIAIIGDIEQSKRILNREEVQDKLVLVLNDINAIYRDDIASKFMITLGDEFQGLLKDGENVLDIIDEIEMRMHPVKLRFGVGIGDINTKINFEMPLGADGPAYYCARGGIDKLKTEQKKKKNPQSQIMLVWDGEGEEMKTMIEYINTILSLCATIKRRWTDRQREIILAYKEVEYNQLKAAVKLNIAQSSVNRALAKADYYVYKRY